MSTGSMKAISICCTNGGFILKPFGRPGWFNLGVAYTSQNQATIKQDPSTPEMETKGNDWAYYGSFNQWLYQDPHDPHKAVGLFGRIGITNGDINLIKRHYSLGISLDGMIPSRPKDVFGIVGCTTSSPETCRIPWTTQAKASRPTTGFR
jgi:porin